ncbi:MAG: DUF1800 family protein [Verrucomicrobiota bacterium]
MKLAADCFLKIEGQGVFNFTEMAMRFLISKQLHATGFFCCVLIVGLQGQAPYTDYIGAGHADGITATASSFDGSATPIKTVDGTGLSAGAHSTQWNDGWLSFNASTNPVPGRPASHWIRYDLGYLYELGASVIWNYNEGQNNNTARGLRSVTIDTSVDGISWTELGTFEFERASGTADYAGFMGPNFGGVNARYVVITGNSKWSVEGVFWGLAEIRIDIGSGAFVDTTPPFPNPPVWAEVPTSIGGSTILMIAGEANDLNGVEYYFEELTGNPGGEDSGWQHSSTYVDSGLLPGTLYQYRFKVRDKSSNQNETVYATSQSVTTSNVVGTTAVVAGTGEAGIDLDGDGMSDIWELYYSATALEASGDADGDTKSNLEESIAGTNPFDADSRFDITAIVYQEDPPNSNVPVLTVEWLADISRSYQIRYSSELANWTDIGAPVTGASGPTSVVIELESPQPEKLFVVLSVSQIDADGDGLFADEEILLGYADTDVNSNSDGSGATPIPGGDFIAAIAKLTSPGFFQLGAKTVSGTPPSMAEASRFLQQATMGADYEMIQTVASSGYATWLENQFALSMTSHATISNAQAVHNAAIPSSPYMFAWWTATLTGEDILRQRVAFALSEIFVISQNNEILTEHYWGITTFYDLLLDNAFGNYRDLLYEVTTNPAMGYFLSHVKNRPTDLANNIFPDENYAREVMQLFSIGLYELNPDGSRKKDINGNDIPTYDNSDITEFARVFTGLTYNPAVPTNGTYNRGEGPPINSVQRYLGAEQIWMGIEMFPYDPMHETGVKNLLNGEMTNGNVQEDLDAAIDNLFNHPNTGPFMGRLLIQRLVTSNPSPAYISRVASAFADNGSGVRGDMKAVLQAILLDPEARNAGFLNNPHHGKLREPIIRHAHLARAFNIASNTGVFRDQGASSVSNYKQRPMQAPSVFNFYVPDHQPPGPIKDAGLVAPEFQITTDTTTIKTLNLWRDRIAGDNLLVFDPDLVGDDFGYTVDYSDEVALAANLDGLLDRLDILLTRGQMSPAARAIIKDTLAIATDRGLSAEEVVRYAVILIASSPDFAILR